MCVCVCHMAQQASLASAHARASWCACAAVRRHARWLEGASLLLLPLQLGICSSF